MLREQGQVTPESSLPERRMHLFPPIPLKDLGIYASYDRLGLANSEVTLARMENTEAQEMIYLGWVNHPFVGEHLGQLVGAVLNPQQLFMNTAGIINDFRMPEEAARSRDQKRGAARLNRLHNEDEYVGPYYQEFLKDHWERWLSTCENKAYDDLFLTLPRLDIIDLEKFTSSLLVYFKNSIPKGSGNTLHVVETAMQFQGGQRFNNLLRQVSEFQGLDDESARDSLTQRIKAKLGEPVREAEIVLDFVDQLDKEDLQDFMVNYHLNHVPYSSPILIDPERNQLWQRAYHNPKATLRDDSTVILNDAKTGCTAEVDISGDGSQNYRWTVTRWNFSPAFASDGINGLLAWKISYAGERSFMTQEEARPLLKNLGSDFAPNGDVMLGRVLAKYFSEKVELPHKMRLHHGKYAQTMMGAQTAVLVSLPEARGERNKKIIGPAKKLLSDNNPVFPVMERYAA